MVAVDSGNKGRSWLSQSSSGAPVVRRNRFLNRTYTKQWKSSFTPTGCIRRRRRQGEGDRNAEKRERAYQDRRKIGPPVASAVCCSWIRCLIPNSWVGSTKKKVKCKAKYQSEIGMQKRGRELTRTAVCCSSFRCLIPISWGSLGQVVGSTKKKVNCQSEMPKWNAKLKYQSEIVQCNPDPSEMQSWIRVNGLQA